MLTKELCQSDSDQPSDIVAVLVVVLKSLDLSQARSHPGLYMLDRVPVDSDKCVLRGVRIVTSQASGYESLKS